ncbi:MAG: hypothetical protein ACI9CQ_000113 [Saprospiraceae bacterium]|jgi:hypothetical protein
MKHLILLFLLLLFSNSINLNAQSVVRGPYLQMVGQETIIIRWHTNSNTSSKVWYGQTQGNLNQTTSNSSLTEEHLVELSGLSANTKYYYAVGSFSGQLAGEDANHYFTTSPEGAIEEPINIWVLGDAGKGGANQRDVRDAFYNLHGDEPIAMALLLGDNAYNDGSESNYQDTWFEDMYEDRLINMPLFSAYGNHDAFTANSESESGPYFDIFNFPREGELGGIPSGTESYYSFDYGDIHVISINDYDEDMTTNGAQYQWLEQDLINNDKGWTIAICHYAPHDGRNGYSDSRERSIVMREVYNSLMESHGIDLVLSGHSHSYQRSVLMDNYYGYSSAFDPDTHAIDMGDGQLDGDGAYQKTENGKGTVYLVSGSAGSISDVSDDLDHPAMYSNHMVLGSVRLQITHDQLDAIFMTHEGIIGDYFTIQKDLPSAGPTMFYITNPLREGFAQPQAITVTNEFNDSTDALTQVQYFVNGLLASTETMYPFFMNYTIPANGEYLIEAVGTTAAGLEYEDDTSFSVGPKSFCKTVYTNENDGEEKIYGSVNTGSGDLELANDNTNQHIGVRFSTLNIPAESVIHSANIQFTAKSTNNINPCNLTIHGEASDNPAIYQDIPFSISSRSKTQASVAWAPPLWQTAGASGPNQETPNIGNVIQELVNRSTYQSDEAMAFIITGTGRRTAFSNDGNPLNGAEICLEYTPAYPADSDGDGTNDTEDLCANGLELGALCNDFNNGTYNDSIGLNCNCVGIFYDCPALAADIGTPCDDGNPATYDDALNASCNCAGTPFDCPIYLTDIGGACDDGNPTTYDDALNASCNCAGTPFDCPIYLTDIGGACDDNNTNTYFDILDANCNCAGVPGVLETVTTSISLESDDAEEKPSGSVSVGSSDLEMMEDGSNTQKVGLRFQNPGIPNAATIVNAYVQFTCDETEDLDPVSISIFGEAADNPTTFVKSSNNISSRSKTNAVAQWSPTEPWIIDEQTVKQQTSDLTAILQEIVNRPGYDFNNAIALILEGSGRRVAKSFDKSEIEAAKLVVELRYVCVDDDEDGVCNNLDDCPLSPNNPGTPCDDGNPETIGGVINENCICESRLPIGEACARIASGNDDAEELSSGSLKIGSSDLELMVDKSTQVIGLRFTGMDIPAGVNISSAKLQFTVDEDENINPCNFTLYGEANNNPAGFVNTPYNISNRSKTNANVSWSPEDWTNEGEAGEDQESVDLSPVLQELVNRPGYGASSPICILFEGVGMRVAMAYEKNPNSAPELCVEWDLSMDIVEGSAGEYQEEEQLLVKSTRLEVIPNPASDYVRLLFEAITEEKIVALAILDVNGKVLLQEVRQMKKGAREIRISNLDLGNGVYFVQLKNKTGVLTGEFVIVNGKR